MKVKIIRSPKLKKKFRAILENGKTVDFGSIGYSDYTKHKNPTRMRSYVLRHGGNVPKYIRDEINHKKIHKIMLRINKSNKENWELDGIDTAGFWSRWYLWSFPLISNVKKFMLKKFKIQIK